MPLETIIGFKADSPEDQRPTRDEAVNVVAVADAHGEREKAGRVGGAASV
jgi:hypothetical protein